MANKCKDIFFDQSAIILGKGLVFLVKLFKVSMTIQQRIKKHQQQTTVCSLVIKINNRGSQSANLVSIGKTHKPTKPNAQSKENPQIVRTFIEKKQHSSQINNLQFTLYNYFCIDPFSTPPFATNIFIIGLIITVVFFFFVFPSS